jgi:Putative lumazine-binding
MQERKVIMSTISTAPTKAGQQDEADIRRAVQMYADGFGSGETRLFEQAFHEEAWIFYTQADGTLGAERLKPRSFDVWAAFPEATIRILSVTRYGDVANVSLVFDGGTEGTWLDLHNLLKIDGVWKITNKTATHISRAGDVPRT